MKSGIIMTRDNTKKLMGGLAMLTAKEVLVGIPAPEASRSGVGPINNAALGYIHENGAPEANIPQRPFLVPGVASVNHKTAAYFRQAGDYALKGDRSGYERALNAAGQTAATAAQRKITAGPFVALRPSTLSARRRRGRTGTRPLIDTGQLRRALTYVIRARTK